MCNREDSQKACKEQIDKQHFSRVYLHITGTNYK